ncbi:MAG: hypothetical protein U9O56_07545 [Campylobacterota bacterium]|nr:hypothetical protein [Campylobacterota bacterium]
MIKFIILFIPILSFSLVNPYDNLSTDDKINILVNLFVNEELKQIIPKPPIKAELKDNSEIVPVKYERHFSFIQRYKTIKEDRAKEQKTIDEQYQGEISFYNSKLKKLKKFYEIDKNLYPIVQNSINKSFKIIYGKPKIKNVKFNKLLKKVSATLYVDDIYGFNRYENKDLIFDIPKDDIDNFIKKYRESIVNIALDYSDNILTLDHIKVLFQGKTYKANCINDTNKRVKLEIKINNDIFQLIKIEDKK